MPRNPKRPPSILLDIYALSQLAGTILRDELRRSGVAADDLGFLSMVAMLEPVTPTELSAELGMPPTTLSHVVARLVERGQLRREPNPTDGRSYLIRLTDAGLAVARDASPAVRSAQARIARELDRPLDEVRAVVDELQAALRAAANKLAATKS